MNTDLSIVSIFPPVLVLAIGYLTHRVLLSLFSGIVLAALIASKFHVINATVLMVEAIWINLTTPSNLHIFIFLILLGIVIVMLQHSGGAYAYAQFVKRRVRSKKSAETSSLILSTALFLDDYLSALTTGSVMHTLTDAKNIPRIKLAFLVDSMSIPFAILCPFSGWVAAVLGFLRENGINSVVNDNTLVVANPFEAYLHTIPYIFYSFIVVASTWFIVRARVSFGMFRQHEKIARETGDLLGGHKAKLRASHVEHNPHHTTLREFFFPILVLLISVMVAITYLGNAATGLMLGGLITVILCTIFFSIRKRITHREMHKVYIEGVKLMYSCIFVLLFAWTLGDFLRDYLYTGEYIASLMVNSVDITFLPMIFYFTAFAVTFMVGSAWGSAAMLFPIAIPLVLSMSDAPGLAGVNQVPTLFPVLGAVLSGCLAGNHVSPICDTTIMSSLSSRSNLKDHIYSQLQYAISGIVITGLAFLLCGLLMPSGVVFATVIPILAAVMANCVLLWFMSKKR